VDARKYKGLDAAVESVNSAIFRVDIYAVSDVLAQILKPSKIAISIEFALAISERSKEMIHSKHMTLIKAGL
jgi:hypothetical protein